MPMISLSKELIGKVFCDKGYISKALRSRFLENALKLITTLKKSMKAKQMDAYERLLTEALGH